MFAGNNKFKNEKIMTAIIVIVVVVILAAWLVSMYNSFG